MVPIPLNWVINITPLVSRLIFLANSVHQIRNHCPLYARSWSGLRAPHLSLNALGPQPVEHITTATTTTTSTTPPTTTSTTTTAHSTIKISIMIGAAFSRCWMTMPLLVKHLLTFYCLGLFIPSYCYVSDSLTTIQKNYLQNGRQQNN